MMTHKGYSGSVKFDADSDIFHGEVVGLLDVVTFQGTTVEELKTAFQESVDDYLEFCQQRGEHPTFSGRFLLRVDPLLHRRLTELSAQEGESQNAWVASYLSRLIGP